MGIISPNFVYYIECQNSELNKIHLAPKSVLY